MALENARSDMVSLVKCDAKRQVLKLCNKCFLTNALITWRWSLTDCISRRNRLWRYRSELVLR